jgi:hypothetical protein
MKKIDLSMVPAETPSSYPRPFEEPCTAGLNPSNGWLVMRRRYINVISRMRPTQRKPSLRNE